MSNRRNSLINRIYIYSLKLYWFLLTTFIAIQNSLFVRSNRVLSQLLGFIYSFMMDNSFKISCALKDLQTLKYVQ